MTALEAIEAVLAETGNPMDCASITERIIGNQLWKTNATVPEQSINAYLTVVVLRSTPSADCADSVYTISWSS